MLKRRADKRLKQTPRDMSPGTVFEGSNGERLWMRVSVRGSEMYASCMAVDNQGYGAAMFEVIDIGSPDNLRVIVPPKDLELRL